MGRDAIALWSKSSAASVAPSHGSAKSRSTVVKAIEKRTPTPQPKSILNFAPTPPPTSSESLKLATAFRASADTTPSAAKGDNATYRRCTVKAKDCEERGSYIVKATGKQETRTLLGNACRRCLKAV